MSSGRKQHIEELANELEQISHRITARANETISPQSQGMINDTVTINRAAIKNIPHLQQAVDMVTAERQKVNGGYERC